MKKLSFFHTPYKKITVPTAPMSVKTVIVSARSWVRILYLHSETPGNGGFCTASRQV